MNACSRLFNSLLLTIAVTISPAIAGSAEDRIEQLEQQRYAALIAGNWDAFDALLADEFFYNQAGGKSVPKAAYLETLRSGVVKVHHAVREASTMRRYGDVVIVTGIAHVDVTLNGEDKALHSRYLHVWVRKENDWKLVARQATSLPATN